MKKISKNPNTILTKLFIGIIFICVASLGIYFFFQHYDLVKKDQESLKVVDKHFEEIANTLANPNNCLSSLKNKSLKESHISFIQKNGDKSFEIDSLLENGKFKIIDIELKNDLKDIAINNTSLKISFKELENQKVFTKILKLYTEVDSLDQVTFCQAISKTFEQNNLSYPFLRVKHAKSLGVLAKFSENKISIAAATCPEGFLLTGCNGNVNECPFESITPYKVEVQSLSPNTCEVRAKATEKCDVTAIATAICAKIIQTK